METNWASAWTFSARPPESSHDSAEVSLLQRALEACHSSSRDGAQTTVSAKTSESKITDNVSSTPPATSPNPAVDASLKDDYSEGCRIPYALQSGNPATGDLTNDMTNNACQLPTTIDFEPGACAETLPSSMTPISPSPFNNIWGGADTLSAGSLPTKHDLLNGASSSEMACLRASSLPPSTFDQAETTPMQPDPNQFISPHVPTQFPPKPCDYERLVHRFFTSTCSIMSIFPLTSNSTLRSNPWHGLIWPLVQTESRPMLYHALMSMACFHNYQSEPNLRLEGTTHMRKSLEYLHSGQQWLYCPIETTLATCIALAFSESWMCWKRNIKSGSSHINTAKQCLMFALKEGAQSRMQKKQLRFLCKTYLYADVIARLTSVDEDTENDGFDGIASKVLGSEQEDEASQTLATKTAAQSDGPNTDPAVGPVPQASLRATSLPPLDPLMGSASSLFPIIGRVANLVRRVYRTPNSTPRSVSPISLPLSSPLCLVIKCMENTGLSLYAGFQ